MEEGTTAEELIEAREEMMEKAERNWRIRCPWLQPKSESNANAYPHLIVFVHEPVTSPIVACGRSRDC
ncbi:hypothetical protein WG66_002636 [Moniliophthora roreri]|nr:hypothetical protein WG66_002636 [Moniliophthora roreri]